jgi:4-amino-4-deoxy-L-arabinose transferase-like glycosyltransferase
MDRVVPRGVFRLVAVAALVRLALAALVPLTVDEAYYAEWARHLQPGYLDHPPAIAWLVAAGVGALGRSALGVRLAAVLLQAATTLLAADLAAARGGRRAAWAMALALQAAPIFSLGALLATPDAPLAAAWVGALWAVDRAGRRDPRWLLAAGAFLGAGALSKLTAGALGVVVLAALATTAGGRALLRTRWAALGAALAAAIAAPMIVWNARHGWAELAFQARHGMSGRSFSVARLAASVGGQAAYVSPVLLAAAVLPAWRALRSGDPAARAVAWSGLPLAVWFTAAAALTPGALPHWAAPAWLSCLVLLAIAGSRALRAGVATGLALQAAAALALAAPVDLPGDPRDEVRGWREGAEAAAAAAGGRRLAAAHWIALGQIAWHADAPVAYVGDRPCAATYYAPDPRAAGAPLLVVAVEGLGPDRASLERRMGPLVPAGERDARTRGGRLVRRFLFYRWDPPPAHVAASP